MKLDLDRTITAVSSPIAPAARAIVRLSGSKTVEVLSLALKDSTELHRISGQNVASQFLDELNLNWSDRSVPVSVYLWPGNRSFTGETCAELHLVGSLPIVHRVVQRLIECGASPAERGEFALRAFLSGKIDLVQAEAVLGVIESNEPQQLDWALEQLAGNISRPVRQLRGELMEILAHLEAGLDFVEEDIEFISHDELSAKLSQIESTVEV